MTYHGIGACAAWRAGTAAETSPLPQQKRPAGHVRRQTRLAWSAIRSPGHVLNSGTGGARGQLQGVEMRSTRPRPLPGFGGCKKSTRERNLNLSQALALRPICKRTSPRNRGLAQPTNLASPISGALSPPSPPDRDTATDRFTLPQSRARTSVSPTGKSPGLKSHAYALSPACRHRSDPPEAIDFTFDPSKLTAIVSGNAMPADGLASPPADRRTTLPHATAPALNRVLQAHAPALDRAAPRGEEFAHCSEGGLIHPGKCRADCPRAADAQRLSESSRRARRPSPARSWRQFWSPHPERTQRS
jgi:hypothetical protein